MVIICVNQLPCYNHYLVRSVTLLYSLFVCICYLADCYNHGFCWDQWPCFDHFFVIARLYWSFFVWINFVVKNIIYLRSNAFCYLVMICLVVIFSDIYFVMNITYLDQFPCIMCLNQVVMFLLIWFVLVSYLLLIIIWLDKISCYDHILFGSGIFLHLLLCYENYLMDQSVTLF